MVDISACTLIQAQELSAVINRLIFPDNLTTIVITQKLIDMDEIEKASIFVENLKNPHFKLIELSGNFGFLPFDQLCRLFRAINSKHWTQELLLCSAQLYRLKDDEILTLVDIIKQNKNLVNLYLQNNQLGSRGIPFLMRLISSLLESTSLKNFHLYDPSEFVVHAFIDKKEKQECINLLKRLPSTNNFAYSPFHKFVTLDEEFELLCEYLTKPEVDIFPISSWVSHTNFSYDQCLILAQLTVKKTKNLIPIENFKLNFEDSFDLYLEMQSKIEHRCLTVGFVLARDTNAHRMPLVTDPFIISWKYVFKNLEDLESNEYESIDPETMDFDNIKDKLCNKVLPILKEACQKVFKDNPFYEDCLRWVEAQQFKIKEGDNFELYRYALLLEWFTWCMCYVARYPIKNLSSFFKKH